MKGDKPKSTSPMGEINQHDIVTKKVLSNKTYAVDFIRNTLSGKIASELDFSKLKVEGGNFIDDKGKERFTDILYNIPFLKKSPVPTRAKLGILALVEHKSYPDKDVSRQILRYLAGLYETRKHVIVPMVLYHGKTKWTIPTNFASCLNIPDHLRDVLMKYVPEFSYELLDLRDEKTDISYFSAPVQALLQTLKDTWFLFKEKNFAFLFGRFYRPVYKEHENCLMIYINILFMIVINQVSYS